MLVILGLVLLIDEWGVFKLLPLRSCFDGDCTWQVAERVGTSVHLEQLLYSEISYYSLTTLKCADGEPSCPVLLSLHLGLNYLDQPALIYFIS